MLSCTKLTAIWDYNNLRNDAGCDGYGAWSLSGGGKGVKPTC